MTYDTILLAKEDRIGRITLNRPDRLNAMNRRMFEELNLALDDLDSDGAMRVVVITGSGRVFCAGDDLDREKRGESTLNEKTAEAIRLSLAKTQAFMKKLHGLSKPTIAMVNGAAVGGGFDIALACDMRIGSDKARFKVAFTALGLIPGTGGPWLLPRLIGVARAAELLFTGDFVEAREAERIGLLNRVAPADDLEKETMALAKKLAGNPPLALRFDKLALYKGLGLDYPAALDMIAGIEPICLTSEDHKEGVAAFREKRPPVFKGR